MKKLILSAALLAFTCNAFCSVYIKYENKDSKSYTFKVRIGGMDKEVTFDNATSAVTIQGGDDKCVIETNCGKQEIKNDSKVIIKDGCLKVE